jgi:RNA polymerase sigma-70 factor (ECF subfamily)
VPAPTPAVPLPLPPDAITRIRAGDHTVFERVFRSYYPALVAFANRFVRDTAGAEDIVQDAFGALWKDRNRLVVRTSLRAYLYAAVRNRALNLRKHDAVVDAWERDESPDEIRELHPSPEPPDRILDRALTNARLERALHALPLRQAQAMRLRWQEELSHAEIAEALDISLKGVEKHLSRGLAALRQALAEP